MRRVKPQVTRAGHDHVLDGGTIGAGRELSIDEDASGKVHIAREGLIVELIREGCRRHCCGVHWEWATIRPLADVRTRGENESP